MSKEQFLQDLRTKMQEAINAAYGEPQKDTTPKPKKQ